MRRAIVLAALVAAAAGSLAPVASLAAQGGTPITAAKRAAGGAAAKANARVAAVSGSSERPAAVTAAPSAAPQPASGSKASASAPKGKAAARPDTTVKVPVTPGASTSVAQRGTAGELTFSREVFAYAAGGRRDPFLSLLKSGDLRPLLSDLKLVTVLYDPTGRNSVAILRDLSTKDQYRVKLGQQLGRMRVAQIQPKQLVFTIEEFGYSRQEVLGLVSDTTSARTR